MSYGPLPVLMSVRITLQGASLKRSALPTAHGLPLAMPNPTVNLPMLVTMPATAIS